MKRGFLSVLAIFLFGSVASFAGDNPAVGKWDFVSDDGHGAVLQWTLSLKESDGKLSGDINEGGTSMPLIDAALSGKTLTFKTFVNPNCTIKYNLKIDGDKFEDVFECPEVSGSLKGSKQKQASGA